MIASSVGGQFTGASPSSSEGSYAVPILFCCLIHLINDSGLFKMNIQMLNTKEANIAVALYCYKTTKTKHSLRLSRWNGYNVKSS